MADYSPTNSDSNGYNSNKNSMLGYSTASYNMKGQFAVSMGWAREVELCWDDMAVSMLDLALLLAYLSQTYHPNQMMSTVMSLPD
jgi:hypothetical protein